MRRTSLCALATAMLASLPALLAADSNPSDQFYQAIRQDDAGRVQQLLKDGADVNTRDGRGSTPLMYAAAMGSPRMMRMLLIAGADAKAKNAFDSTALLWCTNQEEKVRLLVEAGADVNAVSKQGRTPLLVASAHNGNIGVVRYLVAKGADLKVRDKMQSSPLLEAAGADDAAMVKLFLEQGLDPKAKNIGGMTALILAAGNANVEAARLLLAKGAEVNAVSAPSFGPPMKNGPIALGNLTPLLLAASSGNVELVQMLLDAGADINAQDVRGMTPLMLAVATDHPNERLVRLLLERKADAAVKSKTGETAAAWAAKFQNPGVLKALNLTPQRASAAVLPAAATNATSQSPRAAAEKSLVLLQQTSGTSLKGGGCLSCHSHSTTSFAASLSRTTGVKFDERIQQEQVQGLRKQFVAASEFLLERMDPPAVEIFTYTLLTLAMDGAPGDRTTDAQAHNLMAQQRMDGTWGSGGIVRPPMADGHFSRTAMAIRGLRQYAPPGRKADVDACIARSVKWLLQAQPETTEDAVMQLLGAKWAGLDEQTVQRFARNVMSLQRADGGWAQTPHLLSDAYATGTAMYALNQAAGMTPANPVYQKGVQYLMATQQADGSWHVASRAPRFQPYFESGFPYGHDQWISQSATGWAAAALSLASGERREMVASAQ